MTCHPRHRPLYTRVTLALIVGASLAIGALRGPIADAYATAYDVCSSGCVYTHIQDAVDAAVPGATITIGPGMYQENVVLASSVTLVGAGIAGTIVDGSLSNSVFTVLFGISATISGLTIQNGSANSGGGIATEGNLTVTNSMITANTAGLPETGYPGGTCGNEYCFPIPFQGFGGGIYNSAGSLTVIDSTISGNVALSGYGFDTNPSRGNAYGGGIFNDGGSVAILDSTIAFNQAEGGYQGSPGTGLGGGIYNGDFYSSQNNSHMTVTNSTIIANSSNGDGGGLQNSGSMSLANTTITQNSTSLSGNGISGMSPITITDSIVAANGASQTSDCDGTVQSQGYNLFGSVNGQCVGIADGLNSDKVGSIDAPIDSKLGPLQNNGGPTETAALLPGSPAVAAANPLGCTDAQGALLTTDQRGVSRPLPTVARCDMGAFELTESGSSHFPLLVLSIVHGAAGSHITVEGVGFSPNEVLDLEFYCSPGNCSAGTVALGVATADASGVFTQSVTIPMYAPQGPHGIGAKGVATSHFASTFFTVTPPPTIQVSPSSGPDGGTVSVMVRGVGFAPYETIPLGFYCWPHNCGYGTIPLGTITTYGDGSFQTQIGVPDFAPQGPHGIGGTGSTSGLFASTVFTVTSAQTITLSPSAGTIGTPITVTGTGFTPFDPVYVRLYCWPNNCGTGTIFLGETTADADGRITLNIPSMPAAPIGAHGIGAIDIYGGASASAPFTYVAAGASRAYASHAGSLRRSTHGNRRSKPHRA